MSDVKLPPKVQSPTEGEMQTTPLATMLNRPGIHERWLRNAAPSKKMKSIYPAFYMQQQEAELDFYARNGVTSDEHIMDQFREDVEPAKKDWEGLIGGKLLIYSLMKLQQWESEAINKNFLLNDILSTAFESGRLSLLIHLYAHKKFPIRHAGKHLRRLNSEGVFIIIEGILCGADEEAFNLAHAFLQAVAWKEYTPLSNYHVANFILQLLSDYFEKKPVVIRRNPINAMKGEFLPTPYFDELFSVWKTKNPQDLVPYLVSVCDCHTHHAFVGANGHHREFSSGSWSRVPIIPMLIFKLRSLRGLDNPEVDHPLMNTILGKLPVNMEFKPNALIMAVRKQMERDGFDEQVILKQYQTT